MLVLSQSFLEALTKLPPVAPTTSGAQTRSRAPASTR